MGTLRARRYAATTSARLMLGRLIAVIATVVALILALGIVLALLKANNSNGIVSAVHDAARTLAGPFNGLFTLHPRRAELAVNWGVAAVVWFALGRVIARAILR